MRICLAVGYSDHFIKPALPELRKRGHEVKKDQRRGKRAYRENLAKYDIVFCEWLSLKAVGYSQERKKRAKLVIRFHEGEAVYATKRCRAVRWENVDLLVLPSPGTYGLLTKVAPKAKKVPVRYVGNPISLQAFPFLKRKYHHRVGMLGRVTAKKGNLEAVEWLKVLRGQDARYVLIMRGWHDDWYGRRVRDAARKLRGSVELKPRAQAGLLGWFRSIDIITSLSAQEAFHVSICEGMATGCFPVVLEWPRAKAGARWVYPKWARVRNRMEWIQRVRRWGAHSPAEKKRLGMKSRQFVIDHHSVPRFTDRLEAAFGKVL